MDMVRSDDDMVEDPDVERAPNLIELAGCQYVLLARTVISARMVMDEDQR